MKRFAITILLVVSSPVIFYGQDLPFMDGSLSNQQKADHYYGQMAYTDALQYYGKALAKSPDNVGVKLKMAKCYTQLRDPRSALKYYGASITSPDVTGQDMLDYADALAAHGDYEEAKKWYDAYHASTPNETISLQKKESLKHIETLYEDSLAYFVKPAGFNSEKADFSPAYWNKQVLFVSNRASKGLFQFTDGRNEAGFLDIYQYNDGQVSRLDALNKGMNEGPMTFYEDGKKLIVTTNQKESLSNKDHSISSNLKLVIYAQIDGAWHYEADFPYNNTAYSVGHPSYDETKHILYFASNKPGGKGGSDLYTSAYHDGTWSEPKNLEPVNTQGDELFPFISKGGDLYFASSGRGGLGGLDLFKANVVDPKSLVYNLGYPVNTPDDDFGLALDETGRKGYISSNRAHGMGGDDIYELTIFKIRVEAKFIDKQTGLPAKPEKIEVLDQVTGQSVPYELVGGKVVFDALRGRHYKVVAESEGYSKQEMDFDTKTKADFIALDIPVLKMDIPIAESPTKKEEAKTSTGPVALVRFSNLSKSIVYEIMPDEMLSEAKETHIEKDDSLLEIKDIYFKFDSDEIRLGEEELEKVVGLLTKFKTINLEVIAYCDGFGSVDYNDGLSKKRLDKVIGYLNGQGIASTRIKSSAVGSRQLFNSCPDPSDCRVEENQQNRRIEFMLVPGK